jgi:hypothetical protein
MANIDGVIDYVRAVQYNLRIIQVVQLFCFIMETDAVSVSGVGRNGGKNGQ